MLVSGLPRPGSSLVITICVDSCWVGNVTFLWQHWICCKHSLKVHIFSLPTYSTVSGLIHGKIRHNISICISENLLKCNLLMFPPVSSHSVSVYPSTLVRLVSRLAMHAGNCIAWSMGLNQTGKCPLTKALEEQMIRSPPSSVRLVLENMSQELFLWTWNLWW